MKKLFFIASLLWLLPCLSFGQPTAVDLHKLGMITVPQVIEVYNKAIQGDAYAQADIGESLINGSIGVLPNYKQALYWFNKAAKQGEPLAYLNLAFMYLAGNGVAQNDKMARKYAQLGLATYKKKIAHNEYDKYQLAEIQYQVANLYFWGVPHAVKQNLAKSFQVYLKSANNGFVHSIRQITVMYHYGIGTKKNLAEHYKWSLLLAIAGDRHYQYAVGIAELDGIGTDKNVKDGVKWIQKAAANHYHLAIHKLYQLHKQGVVQLDPAQKASFDNIMRSTGDNIFDVVSKSPPTKF